MLPRTLVSIWKMAWTIKLSMTPLRRVEDIIEPRYLSASSVKASRPHGTKLEVEESIVSL